MLLLPDIPHKACEACLVGYWCFRCRTWHQPYPRELSPVPAALSSVGPVHQERSMHGNVSLVPLVFCPTYDI